jgi:hypothetical protein
MPLLRGAIAALLAGLAAASAAAATSKIPALDEKWSWVADARFEVLTNSSERRASELIEELEVFRATISRLNGGELSESATPIRVVIFDHVWDMTPYQALDAQGKPERFAGYFVSDGRQSWITLSNEDREYVPRLVLSSYTYSILARQLGALPVWLRTGLAEYFSAFRWFEREHRAEIGRPISDHLQYLNIASPLPLESILGMTYEAPEFAREVSRHLFYAKSWLLVHYLQLGAPQRAGALARYAQLRANGVADAAALEQAAGCTLRELDDELRVYQKKSLMPLQTVEIAASERGGNVVTRPATREDAVFRLGEYLLALGAGRREEALEHFAAAGRPEPVPPIEPLAMPPSQFQANAQPAMPPAPAARDTRTIETLRAAIERGSAAARDKTLYVERVLELASRNSQGAKAEIAVARRVAAELVAAEPRNDRMWWMLGWFYEADAEHADLDEARRLFESGLARAPETGSIPLGLARILLQQKEVTAARDVVDRALEPGGVTSGRRGLELLQVEIDERQARTLLDQGRGAEGERLLEALLASAEDPEVRGAAAGRLEIYRRLRADSALAERYQAAIALVNSQRIELGAAALREIVRDAPESQWAGLAKSDLEQVEAFLARKKARQQQQAAPPPPPR